MPSLFVVISSTLLFVLVPFPFLFPFCFLVCVFMSFGVCEVEWQSITPVTRLYITRAHARTSHVCEFPAKMKLLKKRRQSPRHGLSWKIQADQETYAVPPCPHWTVCRWVTSCPVSVPLPVGSSQCTSGAAPLQSSLQKVWSKTFFSMKLCYNYYTYIAWIHK